MNTRRAHGHRGGKTDLIDAAIAPERAHRMDGGRRYDEERQSLAGEIATAEAAIDRSQVRTWGAGSDRTPWVVAVRHDGPVIVDELAAFCAVPDS